MQEGLTSNYQHLRTHKEGYYNTKQCLSILNLTIKLWNSVRKEENLYEHRLLTKDNVDFYPCHIIDNLKIKQEQLLKEVEENYYTYSQVRELLGRNEERLTKFQKKLKSIPVPSLIRGFMGKSDKFWLYEKNTIHQYMNERNKKELKNVSLDNDFDTFLYQLEVAGISFPQHLEHTETLWKTYIRDKLLLSNQNEVTAKNRIRLFVRCTECLTSLPKEIFEMTAKEINLSIMSQNISKTYREIIYLFLKEVEESFQEANKRVFSIHQIKNPFSEAKKKREKDVYSFEEYIYILQYANNVDLHREIAISDVEQYLTNPKYSYKRYDSAWLYVLIHLNNPWRHSDIVDSFPRVDLSAFNILDFSWFKENEVTLEIANKIIYQIKRKAMVHNKTGSKRHFFCSEELAISFATAAIICELRTQRDNPLSDCLIDFKTQHRMFNDTIKGHFFEHLDVSIDFKSRKMNRSIISYMYNIISQHKRNNELEIAKYFRGHKDFETTNIYIDIPQSQIDFLTSQLFDRGHFGYIPKIFTDILYGEQKSETDTTKNVLSLQQNFGSLLKIEATAGFLNEVMSERGIVEEIIRGMDKQELYERFQQLLTYQLPSKDENCQCLISPTSCMYPERDCLVCPLSIPNFYAISSITDRVLKKLVFLMEEFEKLEHEAEKIRFANLFHMDMLLLKEAIMKFGKEEVFSFIEISSEQMQILLSHLPSLSTFITLDTAEGGG